MKLDLPPKIYAQDLGVKPQPSVLSTNPSQAQSSEEEDEDEVVAPAKAAKGRAKRVKNSNSPDNSDEFADRDVPSNKGAEAKGGAEGSAAPTALM